jgi:hypothetical protein
LKNAAFARSFFVLPVLFLFLCRERSIMYRSHRAFLSPGDALEARNCIGAADWRDVAPDPRRYEHQSPFLIDFTSLQLYRGRLHSPALFFSYLIPSSRIYLYPLSPGSSLSLHRINPHCIRPRLLYWRRPAVHCGVCSLLLGALAAISLVLRERLFALFLPSRFILISFPQHSRSSIHVAPLSARRGSQHGSQCCRGPWGFERR